MAITVNQIAEKCGVSRTTVLRALNGGSVSKETKERILQVAKDNNYRPNLLARSLNHGRTMSLGVVTINIENMYFVQSLNTINKEADTVCANLLRIWCGDTDACFDARLHDYRPDIEVFY